MFSDIYDIYAKGHEYYAQHETRLKWVTEDRILFLGNHAEHHLARMNGGWTCDCETFKRWCSHPVYRQFCPHVIAVEKYVQKVAASLSEMVY